MILSCKFLIFRFYFYLLVKKFVVINWQHPQGFTLLYFYKKTHFRIQLKKLDNLMFHLLSLAEKVQ